MSDLSLKEQLEEIEDEIEALRERKRKVYAASLEAPEDEKVCGDFYAEALAEQERHWFDFPIEVNAINWRTQGEPHRDVKLVAVRPVDDEKTYVGIHVGDLPLGIATSYHPESGVLSILQSHYNPAIVVPALGRIVMGCESWWGVIKSEEQLRQITDEDIQNIWYVKALRQMEKS